MLEVPPVTEENRDQGAPGIALSDVDVELPARDPVDEPEPESGVVLEAATDAASLQPPPRRAASLAKSPGARRAAIFILSLEESVASRLLRCLSDEELGRISAEIAELGVVDKDSVAEVMREFEELEQLHSLVREGGLEQAVHLVERSFPQDRARRVVQALEANRQKLPLAFLAGYETDTIVAALEDERPQTLAVILSHMVPDQAADLLERIPPDTRQDVLQRIAALEGVSTEALRRVESALKKQLQAARFDSVGDVGGVKAVANILRAADGGGASFLDDLRQRRPELAEEVNKHLFVFEDLVRLDNRALQTALKEVDVRCVALALKNAGDRIREKIMNNLPRRKVESLTQEMDYLGPVKFSEVEAARGEILATVLRLEEAGELFISGRGSEQNRIVY